MFHTLAAGGWVMPFIMACSVIALAICIERHFALNKQRVAPPHLLASVWQQFRADGLDAQRLKSLRKDRLLAPSWRRVWRTGIRAGRLCGKVFVRPRHT